MKKMITQAAKSVILAAGIAFALATSAHAVTVFDQTAAGAYSYMVGTTGIYDITAFGAQGGSASSAIGSSGGFGALAEGEFEFAAGTNLSIIVGGIGGDGTYSGGGGGGSFLYVPASETVVQSKQHTIHIYTPATPLVVAGGGGGDGGFQTTATFTGQTGGVGQAGESGSGGGSGANGSSGGSGGTGGLGGQAVLGGGGGGGGFQGAGENGGSGGAALGGAGGTGSAASGGIGGGGGGSDHSGGGGGGYSGGGGGAVYSVVIKRTSTGGLYEASQGGGAGGGGGSYVFTGAEPTYSALSGHTIAGGNTSGFGEVTISLTSDNPTSVPEPGSMAMLALGVIAVAAARHPRRGVFAHSGFRYLVADLPSRLATTCFPFRFDHLGRLTDDHSENSDTRGDVGGVRG